MEQTAAQLQVMLLARLVHRMEVLLRQTTVRLEILVMLEVPALLKPTLVMVAVEREQETQDPEEKAGRELSLVAVAVAVEPDQTAAPAEMLVEMVEMVAVRKLMFGTSK